jgi:Icc-related predicted phosphoesterase
MRIKLLAVSDEVVPWIHSAQLVERCGDVDVIVSCGDLPSEYLEYIATMLGKPCFYVRGNHDQPHDYRPEGCINLDLRAHRWGKLRLAGLEGCQRYKPGAPLQYSQTDQWLRAIWLAYKLLPAQIRCERSVDIFLSHAPLRGIHDGSDLAHAGFAAFNWLAKRLRPRLWLHGHQHCSYSPLQPRETRLGETLVVNVHPYRLLELSL